MFLYTFNMRSSSWTGGVVVEKGTPKEIFSRPKDPRTELFLKRIIMKDYDYVI